MKDFHQPGVDHWGQLGNKTIEKIVESPHNYRNNANIREKVQIPGAKQLKLRFDSRCSTERSYDVLRIGTEGTSDHYGTFSGSIGAKTLDIDGVASTQCCAGHF